MAAGEALIILVLFITGCLVMMVDYNYGPCESLHSVEFMNAYRCGYSDYPNDTTYNSLIIIGYDCGIGHNDTYLCYTRGFERAIYDDKQAKISNLKEQFNNCTVSSF